MEPRLLIPLLLDPGEREEKLDAMHRAQVMGQLAVSEREWCDLVVYAHVRLPVVIHRIYRDEKYIGWLWEALARFNAELDSLVETIRAYGTVGFDPDARLGDVTDLGLDSPPAF